MSAARESRWTIDGGFMTMDPGTLGPTAEHGVELCVASYRSREINLSRQERYDLACWLLENTLDRPDWALVKFCLAGSQLHKQLLDDRRDVEAYES